MWTRRELKDSAKDALKNNYGMVICAVIIFLAINYALSYALDAFGRGFLGALSIPKGADFDTIMRITSENSQKTRPFDFLLTIFLVNPLAVGLNKFFINNQDGEGNVSDIFWAFSKDANYFNIVVTMLLMEIKVALWTLLFIIPGIVKSYEYRMVPYILCDNPDMKIKEIFELSKEMTNGEKFNIFVLDLSFIPWWLLACTVIIIPLWILPYQYGTNAELYLTLNDRFEDEEPEPEIQI